MKYIYFVCKIGVYTLALLHACSVYAQGSAPSVRIYTFSLPPLINTESRTGLAYELVEATFERAGISQEIIFLPWQRAQRAAMHEANVLIFPLARSTSREDKYDWSIKLLNITTHFVTLSNSSKDPSDWRKMTIGVAQNSGLQSWLVENGYQNIATVPSEGDMPLSLLLKGRFDAWFTEKSVAVAAISGEQAQAQVKLSKPLKAFDLYLATNITEPSPHVPDLRKAFEALHADGTITAIMQKYGQPEITAEREH